MEKYSIKSGDTFDAIARSKGIDINAVLRANPGVDPTKLQVGQSIDLPASSLPPKSADPHRFWHQQSHHLGATSGKYIVVSGDTFSNIASRHGIDIATVQHLNEGVDPASLQVGQVINVPGPTRYSSSIASDTQPPPLPPKPWKSTGETYKIEPGDTFSVVANRYGSSASKIERLNPGVNPSALQVGQIINVPQKPPPIPLTVPQTGGVGGCLVGYRGPFQNFPPPECWASYEQLWAHNSKLMQHSNSAFEIDLIGRAINQVSYESGIDPRVILCMCMQETGGNIRSMNTVSPAPDFICNTGIMQAHNGTGFDPADPQGSITQMIRDGTMGTNSGDGLKQCFERRNNYYEALREYNSGSVDCGNLSNGITATADYVSKSMYYLLLITLATLIVCYQWQTGCVDTNGNKCDG